MKLLSLLAMLLTSCSLELVTSSSKTGGSGYDSYDTHWVEEVPVNSWSCYYDDYDYDVMWVDVDYWDCDAYSAFVDVELWSSDYLHGDEMFAISLCEWYGTIPIYSDCGDIYEVTVTTYH